MSLLVMLALWGPLVAAVLVAGGVALKIPRNKLTQRMGMPAWDFSQSWASNLSVVGGLVSLSTVTGLLASKSQTSLPAVAYTALDFAFPLLAILAPLVYKFSGKVTVQLGPPPTILNEGIVAMFLVAGVFTIWACTGQLVLQALWLLDLNASNGTLAGFGILVAVVLILVALGVLYYAFRTMVDTINAQTDAAAAKGRKISLIAVAGRTRAESWPLL